MTDSVDHGAAMRGRLSALSVGIVATGALALLTLYPIGWLILTSLQPADGSGITLANYTEVFTNSRFLNAIATSLQVAAAVSVLATVIGVAMAWAVGRTDMPCKGFIRFCVIGSFITPPFLGAIAWILLAAPRAGVLNRIIAAITGLEPTLLNIYSLPGLTFVMAIYAFPFAFLFTATALELMSSEMEDAAVILGGSTWLTIRAITLPLVLPAILGAFILTFVESLALLGSPLLLTTPARIQLITTQVWEFFQFPTRLEYAAAYSLPLLLITAALLFAQQRLLRRKGFATLTGKGGSHVPLRLGPLRYVALGGCLIVCTLALFLPYAALLVASLSRAWGRDFALANLTLENFRWILFTHDTTREAILNSVSFSAAAASLAMGIAFLVSYVHARQLMRGASVLAYLAMSPAVIPGIVLAIGFLIAFAGTPFYLYGTAAILILAFATRFMPIAFASTSAALRSVHFELEDAARISGASRLRTVSSITVPMIGKGLTGGWLLVMLSGVRELSAAIFLFGASTKVMAVMLIDLSEEGQFERLSALSVVMLVMTFLLVLVGYGVAGRQFVWQRP